MGGGIFILGRGGARPPGPGAGNPAAAACIAATICTSRAAPVGGGACQSYWSWWPWWGWWWWQWWGSPPPGPTPPSPGGTGAAISNTQCSSRLNLTLLVNTWSINTQLMQASGSLVCFYRLMDCKGPWSLAIVI